MAKLVLGLELGDCTGLEHGIAWQAWAGGRTGIALLVVPVNCDHAHVLCRWWCTVFAVMYWPVMPWCDAMRCIRCDDVVTKRREAHCCDVTAHAAGAVR